MKSLFVALVFYAICLPIIPSTTKADLVGVLPTAPGGNDYQAYYDTVADLTWLKSATASGAMTWSNANAWVASLNINGVTGWRLPDTLQPDTSCSDQVIGIRSYGYNCTGSELGNLYYNVLDGVAGTSITTTHNSNYDLFTFVGSFPLYWSATEYTSSPTSAWSFDLNNGWQITALKTASKLAWAVHDGNVGNISAIDIEKLTNGNQADSEFDIDVPTIAQGEAVTWTYKVTNTSLTDLSEAEIVITDSQPGVVPVLDTASDTGGDLVLSPGETWTYTASAQALDLKVPPQGVSVVIGCIYSGTLQNTYENIGRAEIVGVGVVDEDPSHYCNPFVPPVDSDNDGVFDDQDNCINEPNGPLILDAGGNSQRDTDGDGYGNRCDADIAIPNDGVVNLSDYSAFRSAFGGTVPLTPAQEDADFNGDGVVNLSDYSIFRAAFGKAPGPSCCAP